MNESILTSIKKVLGIAEEDTNFDVDIIMHINTVFSILNELGVGEKGFTISDKTKTWSEYIDNIDVLALIKSYMYLRVRLLFDPPTSSFVNESFKKNADELEWRLNEIAEAEAEENV
ncbi:MAG: hypothetical protein HUJ78_00095 [Mogibacterium sp.]|nr:hypothetical protein [Mogibacterium sp.]